MNKNTLPRSFILLCLDIIALAALDLNDFAISRWIVFFAFAAAGILIGPDETPLFRVTGLLLQTPALAFHEKFIALSSYPQIILCILYFACLGSTLFSVRRLELKKATGLALSLALAAAYSIAFSRIELARLVLPAALLNMIVFAIAPRAGRFKKRIA